MLISCSVSFEQLIFVAAAFSTVLAIRTNSHHHHQKHFQNAVVNEDEATSETGDESAANIGRPEQLELHAYTHTGTGNGNHHTLYGDDGHRWRNESSYSTRILVNAYNSLGQLTYRRAVADLLETSASDWDWWMCDPSEKFAVIVHGWRENCSVQWARMLRTKLHSYRGGCVLCFDYSHFAGDAYFRLVRHFDPIAAALTRTLLQLQALGFRMEAGYAFGFSFGGQLVVEAGRRIGSHRLADVDTSGLWVAIACDMAGPGFDHRPVQSDHRLAGSNVQCVHTASGDKGTRHFRCHQNWRLGNCGQSQAAAVQPPFGSHGLCPYMYVAAFEVAFRAIEKPAACVVGRLEAKQWPSAFQMGYRETRKGLVLGELFANTGSRWPYNVDAALATNQTVAAVQPLPMQNDNVDDEFVDYVWR